VNDGELTAAWAALEPTAQRRRRVDTRVFEWVEARETSLASEWLGLLTIHPVAGLSLSAAGALSLALATPLNWVTFSILF
jgi:hypothetical protein